MTELLDLIPIFTRTESEIRASVNATANLGLPSDDPRWVDTREGSMFWICTQPFVIELARLYDRAGSEAVAASNVATAWGTWLDRHGESFRVFRKAESQAEGVVTFAGTEGTLIASGVQVSTAKINPDDDPILFETIESGIIDVSGILDLPVRAVLAGPEANISAGSIVQLASTVSGVVTSVTNDDPMGGGADVESDDDYRVRIQIEFQGKGSGNQADYRRWALQEPGIGRVWVKPAALGPGTVRLVVADVDGQAVGSPIRDSLRDRLDPVAGEGAGVAPIGHAVSVATPTVLDLDVAATVVTLPGYSTDGSSGINIGPQIRTELEQYTNKLGPGDEIVANHARATFFEVEGVLDVTALTLNTGSGATSSNITLGALESAKLDTVTLS